MQDNKIILIYYSAKIEYEAVANILQFVLIACELLFMLTTWVLWKCLPVKNRFRKVSPTPHVEEQGIHSDQSPYLHSDGQDDDVMHLLVSMMKSGHDVELLDWRNFLRTVWPTPQETGQLDQSVHDE